jgi:hypothetical protein
MKMSLTPNGIFSRRNMRLAIVPKSDLSARQSEWINSRLACSEHSGDTGPPRVWNAYEQGLFAVVDVDSTKIIGLVEASGQDHVSPGWWIDKEFRGTGCGNELVDALALYLKEQGVSHVGKRTIQTTSAEYAAASNRLYDRFEAHFS